MFQRSRNYLHSRVFMENLLKLTFLSRVFCLLSNRTEIVEYVDIDVDANTVEPDKELNERPKLVTSKLLMIARLLRFIVLSLLSQTYIYSAYI